MKKKWTIDDMPEQTGKTVLITGANDGLGFLLTKSFAMKNARVVMACRNRGKAENAKKEILKLHPRAELDIVQLDLGDLESVRQCAKTVSAKYKKLDVVMCNGGIMAVPYGRTRDGIEMHMGVNYYGHYALLGHLMPLIKRMPGERGVLPLLYAASAPEIEGGEYVGVSGPLEMHGYPKITKGQIRAYDRDLRRKLREKSAQLTHVRL